MPHLSIVQIYPVTQTENHKAFGKITSQTSEQVWTSVAWSGPLHLVGLSLVISLRATHTPSSSESVLEVSFYFYPVELKLHNPSWNLSQFSRQSASWFWRKASKSGWFGDRSDWHLIGFRQSALVIKPGTANAIFLNSSFSRLNATFCLASGDLQRELHQASKAMDTHEIVSYI